MLFSSVHIVYMHSFNFIKIYYYIFSFDITNIYFYCFGNWLVLSSFLVIVFVSHAYFLLYKVFCLFPVRGFRVFATECVFPQRIQKPQKVLISKLFEVWRLYLILNTFPSILCAQGSACIKQCSILSMRTYRWSLKVVLLFLEAKLLPRYQVGSFLAVS